ncbi:uncharacterized protein LOC127263055 isoform X2 [Andrographis paniculata]|uniref:uncharacterized protein LOC127263055 isoform X2 n=1 Tax=Andrographis paniculata TaxID=175694 RepID=UPI0021E90AF1|nr:uncharacterized protein LOC127263055 isoform X2 [Andrographis paniculata]
MLSVCSATATCSCYAKVPINGGLKSVSHNLNLSDFSSNNAEKSVLNILNRSHIDQVSIKTQPASSLYTNYVDGSMDTINQLTYPNGLGNLKHLGPIMYIDSSSNSAGDDQLLGFVSDTMETVESVQVDSPPVSSNIDVNSSSGQEVTVADVVSKVNQSVTETIKGGEDFLNNFVDTVTSSVTTTFTDAKEAVDSIINDVVSFANKSGESANNKLTGLAGGAKDVSGKAGSAALDVLRNTTVVIENSLIEGAKTVGYAYGSAKEFLPPDFRDALKLSEESILRVLNPAGAALQQVYVVVEGFEKSLGLDPNDPLIPLALFVGATATLWVLRYSGYAGDLSPKLTFELLRGKEKVALIDIRPENLREKDGIPDLRRAARSRYASVTLPEIDGSVKRLLKGGRDIEDSLLAIVIRNLKIVEKRSKVVVMDADGSRSKGVARTLSKLGIKRPYLVQGGFRSWVNEGIRVKALKPETAFTVLNEEAEAILEEINPTPLKLLGFGLVVAVAAYSAIEWERTLQFIGIIGIGQTVFRRVASYQDSGDFTQDVRLLLSPVKLGGEAISWVAGKLETNINGLPMSPSSLDVQSRVLQAAAKHESQPSDGEDPQDPSSQMASGSDNVKVSEA